MLILFINEGNGFNLIAHRGSSWAPQQMGRQKEKPSEKLRQRALEIILSASAPAVITTQLASNILEENCADYLNVVNRSTHHK